MGAVGIEPTTSALSEQRSTTELRTLYLLYNLKIKFRQISFIFLK